MHTTSTHAGPQGVSPRDVPALDAANATREHARHVLASGQPAQAVVLLGDLIRQQPHDAVALVLLGQALLGVGDASQACRAFSRAIERVPDSAEAALGMGEALGRLGHLDESLKCFEVAQARRHALPPALWPQLHVQHGMALGAKGLPGEALGCFDAAIGLAPDGSQAHFFRGNALRDLGRLDEALIALDKALGLNAQHVPAIVVKGQIFGQMQNYPAAQAAFEQAIALAPRMVDAHHGLGRVREEMGDVPAAGRAYTEVLRLDERHTGALQGLINCLIRTRHFDRALVYADKLAQVRPDAESLASTRLFLQTQVCQWDGRAGGLSVLRETVGRGEAAMLPFQALLFFDDPALLREATRLFMAKHHPLRAATCSRPPLAPGERLRIGYFSADFFEHATAYLMSGLLAAHDRRQVEVIAFSYRTQDDAMRQRIAATCDQFVDVAGLSDEAIAARSRALGIHIAVDLKGLTEASRPGIFAGRAAPVQVNWLGFPGTLAAPYYDYLLADHQVVPDHLRQHYSEALAWLPHSYQPNDGERTIAPTRPTRVSQGLPAEGPVLACFNNNFKITPEIWALWMRLLKAVPQSTLWLLESHDLARENLHRHAAAHGVDPVRVVFAKHVAQPEHLARLQLADLSLETLPCNAHTTASDALWAGVPHLTCMGDAFAARVGGSLLAAVGLPELITRSLAEYEALALALLHAPSRLLALRQRLAENRLTAPLFDTEGFTRHLEAAYRQMWERCAAGVPPEDFEVGEPPSPIGFCQEAAESMSAAELLMLGDFVRAEAACIRQLEMTPRDVDALHILAQARLGQRRSEDAVSVLRSALELAPHKAGLWFNLAQALLRLPQPDTKEAMRAMTCALEIDPHDRSAQALYAIMQRAARGPDVAPAKRA